MYYRNKYLNNYFPKNTNNYKIYQLLVIFYLKVELVN